MGRPVYRPWLRMPRRRRPIRRRRRGLFSVALAGIGLALLVIVLMDCAFRPVVTTLAQAKAHDAVTGILNDAVSWAMSDQAVSYSDLVTLEKDETGRVTVLSTDSAGLNALRVEILERILQQVEELDSQELGIPLGALTGFSIASDWGPILPVQVLAVAVPDAAFHSEFISAGINQTLHRIRLDVTVEVTLLIPGGTVSVPVEAQVPVAETLLVGEVPNSYLELPDGTS